MESLGKTVNRCIRAIKARSRPASAVPVFSVSCWGATLEACLFVNQSEELEKAVRNVFYSFDKGTQHALTFSPKEYREWAKRVDFWRVHLRSLPQKQYYQAMSCITNWYTRCQKI